MVTEVREVGSPSSVKEYWRLGQSMIFKSLRLVSKWRPNSVRDVSLSQFVIERETRLEGRLGIGNISSGQLATSNDRRHTAVCTSDLRFSHFLIEYVEKLRAVISTEARLGHLLMNKRFKDVGFPSEIEKVSDSRPRRSQMSRINKFGKMLRGKHKTELQVLSIMIKLSRKGW